MALATNFEHTSVTTREFKLEFLEQITDNFSKERIIGRGGYGVVYKGILENGEEVALKKLHRIGAPDDVQFMNEFNNLMRAQHPNITRLVGYCYDVRPERVKFKGQYIMSLVEERVLCFEYLQGGSLDQHISDESCILDWHTCFKIIKGVCLGLNYLHNGSKDPIYHLDLKPANILLDKNMVPKIGDFGLSRLFPSAQTCIASKIIGTLGYMPPEYIERKEITSKYDVFSLGVIIIRIIAGHEGYSKCAHTPLQEFLEHVHENWGKRLQTTMPPHTSDQIQTCIEIALRCVEVDREKRPTIAEIVGELNKVSDFQSKPALNQNTLSECRGGTPLLPFHAWSTEDEVHVTVGVLSPLEPQTRHGHPLRRRWLSSSWRRDLARLALALAVIVGVLAGVRAWISLIVESGPVVYILAGVSCGILSVLARIVVGALFGFIMNEPILICIRRMFSR
ncbi:putative receptor-like protein kinase At4g00960 [Triticum dicoccoides]|uniref:putative receptor-like protein kinase At4g00960 n=1 Tax=Triticum dicoccoides TaxID=85692 RepID=UPI001891D9D6|nr:putative receptor-like protein kinase At4g00960 [Triticum dicoccoides]